MGSKIKEVTAKEIFSVRGHVTLQVTVTTEDGSRGTHNPSSGVSMGKYEAAFLLDGGERWFGRGLGKAVDAVNTVMAPALKGMDVTQQRAIDDAMIRLDGTPNKSRLGANTIVCVSIAVLKAAANSSRLPLYRYIGGVNARTLPCPRIGLGIAGTYRDPGETRLLKPSYELAAYGAKAFSESVYMSQQVQAELEKVMRKRHGYRRGGNVLAVVKDDRDALAAITEAIENTGLRGKVGIVVDLAAGCFYEPEKDKYVGLLSEGEKTREDMIELYKSLVKDYPFVAMEDPLHEDDFEGHAILTKELGIEIVGDDLTVTNPTRVQRAVEVKAVNAMVLKIPQIGTVSEALDAVHLAQRSGWEVDPCGSRGDPSADLAVGLNCGDVRGDLNRLLDIEEELGSSARFLGRASYKASRLQDL